MRRSVLTSRPELGLVDQNLMRKIMTKCPEYWYSGKYKLKYWHASLNVEDTLRNASLGDFVVVRTS